MSVVVTTPISSRADDALIGDDTNAGLFLQLFGALCQEPPLRHSRVNLFITAGLDSRISSSCSSLSGSATSGRRGEAPVAVLLHGSVTEWPG